MEHLDIYRQTTLPRFQKSLKTALPHKIGPYFIDSLLHESSMSLLYMAHNPKDKAPIVIKVIPPHLVGREEIKEQFLEETKIIQTLSHPHIVRLLDEGTWEQGLYIAMEFIQGVSLRQFILNKSLSLAKSIDLILQIAYALLHLHTHGIIHRDLKPENILIDEHGNIKIIDFGIARFQKNPLVFDRMKSLIGTPSYMSPEQKKDPKNISFASDIYSLGVIAYELISGKLSFGNIQLEHLPQEIRKILAQALAPQKQDRFHDVVDFITALSQYLKANLIGKDASLNDEIKDVLTNLEKEHIKLLPLAMPEWQELSLSLAKPPGSYLFGLYYDFFRLPDGSFVIIFAESENTSFDSLVSISTLRGIIRGRMHNYLRGDEREPFVSSQFAFLLNQIFSSEPHGSNEAIALLHLSPLLNQFSFVSSGFEAIWHLSTIRGGKTRVVRNQSPLLGKEPGIIFYSTNDSWNPGDILVMHSFTTLFKEEKEKEKIIEETSSWIEKNRFLSPEKMSEALLHHLKEFVDISLSKEQKIVLSSLRIA